MTLLLPLPDGGPAWAGQFLVAVDAGHSKVSVGATSATGIGEYDFNESLARLLLSRAPRDSRIRLSFINGRGDDMPLEDRARAASAMGADLLLSIHHDSVLPEFLTPWTHDGRALFYCDLFHGFAVFYSEKNNYRGRSLRFAKLLGSALVEGGFSPSQHHVEMLKGEGKAVIDAKTGVFQYDALSVLKNAKMPAVLLECGIIVNREAEKRLMDNAYKNGIVSAILKSIEVFSGARKK
jgi:N-acetylmuramoyl-L-alanine amidase